MYFENLKEELKEMEQWAANHTSDVCTMKYFGAIRGAFTYSFTPTNLGVICTVECTCGAKHDATDYDSW